MAKKPTADSRTLDLIKLVKVQKAEIAKLDKPSYKTNCSFTYIEGRANDAVPLHAESDVKNLISYAAFLIDKERSYKATASELGVEVFPDFTWSGYTVADWLSDIKTRIAKVQIAIKKKKLEGLEARLNSIISPELRAELELEAIANELG